MRKKLFIITVLILLTSETVQAEAIRFGTTFSQTQCDYLEIDWKEAYRAILDIPFDLIRLSAYWDRIETQEGQYDFSELDWQIAEAKARGIPVVLVLGMKAPRWPEYHIPAWVLKNVRLRFGQVVTDNSYLREKTLKFTEKVLARYRDETIIQYWQVKNEALNRFGGRHWRMDKYFLTQEVALVRDNDPLKRPIVLTASTYPNHLLRIMSKIFTNTMPVRDNIGLADIFGINVYPLIGIRLFGQPFYYDSRKSARINYFENIREESLNADTDIWVTELQAEPWEPGHLAYKDTPLPRTGLPETTRRTLEELNQLGYTTFFFWGAEFWYHQKTAHQDAQWWDAVEELIVEYKKQDFAK